MRGQDAESKAADMSKKTAKVYVEGDANTCCLRLSTASITPLPSRKPNCLLLIKVLSLIKVASRDKISFSSIFPSSGRSVSGLYDLGLEGSAGEGLGMKRSFPCFHGNGKTPEVKQC
jgi:hypothetical protein